jgi:hypothetical protein
VIALAATAVPAATKPTAVMLSLFLFASPSGEMRREARLSSSAAGAFEASTVEPTTFLFDGRHDAVATPQVQTRMAGAARGIAYRASRVLAGNVVTDDGGRGALRRFAWRKQTPRRFFPLSCAEILLPPNTALIAVAETRANAPTGSTVTPWDT